MEFERSCKGELSGVADSAGETRVRFEGRDRSGSGSFLRTSRVQCAARARSGRRAGIVGQASPLPPIEE